MKYKITELGRGDAYKIKFTPKSMNKLHGPFEVASTMVQSNTDPEYLAGTMISRRGNIFYFAAVHIEELHTH